MDISFHHICIETDRYGESLAFYTGALGFRVEEETANFHGRDFNTWLANNDSRIELQTPRPEDAGRGRLGSKGIMHVCFRVEDLDAAIRGLEERGFGGFYRGRKKYRVEGNDLCKIVAPEGTIIELRE